MIIPNTIHRALRRRPSTEVTAALRLAALGVTVCVLSACAGASREPLPYSLTEKEERAVRSVLAADSTWRLAVESDSRNPAGISELRTTDRAFQPYFCRVTDSSGVTSLSFVMTRSGEFKVYHARAEALDSLILQEVATVSWLHDGFIRLSSDSLEIAPFNSDEIVTFVWDATLRKLVLAPEPSSDEDEVPPVSGLEA